MVVLVAISAAYFIKYDPVSQTEGLTVWSIQKAKEMFKGRKINEEEGEKVFVHFKLKETDDGTINFSKNDMAKMKANVGDLVYLCDKRAWLGGLKSVHSVYGEPHDEDGVVYIGNEELLNGQFVHGKMLYAEKEL
jgi:SSS family solute:Na+ symporter